MAKAASTEVTAQPQTPTTVEAELADLDRFADLLDSRFSIPGTGIRFGLDGLLGLVPGVGDLVTIGPMGYLLWKAHRLGVRRRVMARMAVNTGLDFAIGSIPLAGDLFDIWFKANRRNVALLRGEVERRATSQTA